MANIFVRFLDNPEKDPIFQWQWSRFKRREQSFWFVAFLLGVVNVLVWILWLLFVAPYPQSIHIPLLLNVTAFRSFWEYLWPMSLSLLTAINILLARMIYKKDIFLAWVILGLSALLALVALAIVISLSANLI